MGGVLWCTHRDCPFPVEHVDGKESASVGECSNSEHPERCPFLDADGSMQGYPLPMTTDVTDVLSRLSIDEASDEGSGGDSFTPPDVSA